MIVQAVLYCPCIYESGYTLISLHNTKSGAYNAMRAHIDRRYNDDLDFHQKFGKKYRRGHKFLKDEAWRIEEYKVNDS